MIKLKDLLNEINSVGIKTAEELYIECVRKLWKSWVNNFPDEVGIENPQYMEHEILRNLAFSEKGNGNPFLLIQNLQGNSSQIKSPKIKPISSAQSACYYNALDYVLRFKKTDPELELAWGLVCFEEDLIQHLQKISTSTNAFVPEPNKYFVLHGFVVRNNAIIDPTMKTKWASEKYYYDIIPESVWAKFTHTHNDSRTDASMFYTYMQKKIDETSKYDYIIQKL